MSKVAKPVRNWRTRHIDVLLGARIVELRTIAGLNRSQLARRLGVSNAQLQHVEEGENRISAPQLWQMCSILGVEVGEVFAGVPAHIVMKRDVAGATDRAFSGVGEEASHWVGPDSVRSDIVALARTARRLTPQQVQSVTEVVKAMKPKP